MLHYHLIVDHVWVPMRSQERYILSRVSKSDAGLYKCRAENGMEPAIETTFQVHVLGMNTALSTF